jgi:hypothetical protein
MSSVPSLQLNIWRYECARCGATTDVPTLEGDYGELTARSTTSGRLIYIRAIGNPVFREVAEMVRSVVETVGMELTERGGAEVTQAVFSVACDPDTDGGTYGIDAPPICASCGSKTFTDYRGTDELVNVDLAEASYLVWSTMPPERRRELVRGAVLDELSR